MAIPDDPKKLTAIAQAARAYLLQEHTRIFTRDTRDRQLAREQAEREFVNMMNLLGLWPEVDAIRARLLPRNERPPSDLDDLPIVPV